jgi:hypothetical protein
MKLLSFDINHKYASLVKAISSKNIIQYSYSSDILKIFRADTSEPAPAPGNFWTSGTDQGCVGSFAWCAARKIFYMSKWAQGQPVNSTQAKCVTVSVDATAAHLETADCATPNRFICEVWRLLSYYMNVF